MVNHIPSLSQHVSGSPSCVDVIVVGMGPAGASAALELSRCGFSVLAFDKQAHPRYKVCGGGLSARIERILPDDFQSVVEEVVHRVQFTYGEKESFVLDFSRPVAYMVMRANFDRWLVEKARKAGADIREGESVLDLSCHDSGVEVRTDRGRYRSRFVVGADGAMSVVAQRVFPEKRFRKIPALESECPRPYAEPSKREIPTALISLSAAEKGYGWIFPKRDGFSLGIGEFVHGANRPKQSFEAFVRGEASLAGLTIPPPMGHLLPIAHQPGKNGAQVWKGHLVRERAVLVGDAGHLVDPLLGEGIYYAVRSGQLAAKNLVAIMRNPEYRLDHYEEHIAREFGPEFCVAAKMHRIIYGVPRSWHRWAGRVFPHAYQRVLWRYCEVLQGGETYQSLWKRITRRLMGPFAGH